MRGLVKQEEAEGDRQRIALAFAEAGVDVAIHSRMIADGKLEATAGEIRGLGWRSLTV